MRKKLLRLMSLVPLKQKQGRIFQTDGTGNKILFIVAKLEVRVLSCDLCIYLKDKTLLSQKKYDQAMFMAYIRL